MVKNEFADRKVLITGAAGGIGEAIACVFLERGALVALADVRRAELERIREEVGTTERTLDVVVDVCNPTSIAAALDKAWSAFSGLDTLINAAGIYPSQPLLTMTEADWDKVLDTNLKGAFLFSQGFAQRLVAANVQGHIVNITSGASQRARPGAAHYCTSKAGLEMLTKAFAVELAFYGIHVNAVSPGFIDVASEVNPLSDDYVAAVSQSIPWERPGQPKDIANAVAFLCGEDASWITGESLSVDGGSGAGNARLPLSSGDRNAGAP